MGVTRAGLAVVTLALLVGAKQLDDESLQSPESSLTKNDFSDDAELVGVTRKIIPVAQQTGLREFEDHAEMNLQSTNSPAIQEETMVSPVEVTTEGVEQEASTSELSEPLPTPLPNKTEGSSAEATPESHLSDLPLKNNNSFHELKKVTTKKPSVVPKKGVGNKKPSVPKKGADPNSLTSSIFPRKGVGEDPKSNEEGKGETIPYSGTDVEAIPESHIDEVPLDNKNSFIAWEGVTTKKSSVVPRKGVVVFKEPSVVSKKSADPNSVTPSVVARKGVDVEGLQSSVSSLKEANPWNNEESNGETITYSGHLSVPQYFVPITEQKNNLGAMSNDTTSLSSNYSSTVTKVVSAISVSANSPYGGRKNVSYKKDQYNQEAKDSESKGGLSGEVILLLALLVCILVTVVVGYIKLKAFTSVPRGQYAFVAHNGGESVLTF